MAHSIVLVKAREPSYGKLKLSYGWKLQESGSNGEHLNATSGRCSTIRVQGCMHAYGTYSLVSGIETIG